MDGADSEDTVPTLLGEFARPVGVVMIVAGVVHLLLPQVLLRTAKIGYDVVLDIQFTPRDGAIRRVRSVGVGMVATGAHLFYHGRLVPE